MSKKNIYMVQVDVASGIDSKSVYLPYAVGLLIANSFSNPQIRNDYDFKGFIFKRDVIEDIVDGMENPYVVGFSCYCWNTEFNKALACKIKERYPQCIIMFGGHNVSSDDSFLLEFPYIDFLMHGEGEETFKNLLLALPDGDLNSIPNISYRDADGKTQTTAVETPCKLDEFPSPYLDGWFDNLVEDKTIRYNAILETSRGCPHQCAYCDWGILKSKTRYFSVERVKAEILWMAEHNIEFIWGADANFGLKETDIEIADALIEAKRKYGFPERIRINYSKNNFERVHRIANKFRKEDMDRIGATLSFQSMSPKVLEAIGRKNMSLDYYKNLITQYNNEGLKSYSELILGLPEETYESYIKGVSKIYELGQHFSLEAYICCVLPNSILGQKDYREKYKIESVRVEPVRNHTDRTVVENDIKEYHDIVISTSTLSTREWIRAAAFTEMVKALHGFGFLRPFSIYLYYYENVTYDKFYDGFIDYMEANPDMFISSVFGKVSDHYEKMSQGNEEHDMVFEPTGNVIWQDCDYLTLKILENLDAFYSEVEQYVKSYNIEPDIYEDLLNYERALIRYPNKESSEVSLRYDVHDFLKMAYANETPVLRKVKNNIKMYDTDVHKTWIDYAKYVVWYGRLSWKSYMDKIDITYEEE